MVAIQQFLERFRPQKRDIAGEQNDRACRPFEDRFGRQQGVAGAELWLLDHISETSSLRKSGLYSVGLMADNDRYRGRPQSSSAFEDVSEHGRTGDLMQDFWSRRLQARAQAGREDDDVNVGHVDRSIIYRPEPFSLRGRPGPYEWL
jgi:hypothetical protein